MPINKFTHAMHLFILKNAAGISTRDLTALFNAHFGVEFTVEQLHAYKSRNKILNGLTGADSIRGKSFIFTPEMQAFLKENHKGTSSKELTKKLNKKFGTSYKVGQITRYRKTHNLPSGNDTRFKPGNVSANKGQKMTPEQYEKCKATMFKKGQTPHNQLPVGAEVKDHDGYIKVKTGEPNKWAYKHRLVYEKHFKLKIPAGKMITFLDGNKENCSIENLALIDNNENLYIMRNGLRSKHAEITQTGINIARLDIKIKEKEASNEQ